MPIPRRRSDGFSDDGLSYSVASDFDKQMGQALAEIEARTKEQPQSGVSVSDQIASKSGSQRYNPFGPSPDDPLLLQRQLIDPILESFGMPNSQKHVANANKTYEIGNELIDFDPATRKATSVYKAPEKPPVVKPERFNVPTGFDLLGKPTVTQKLTLDELNNMAPNFPDQVRTNSAVAPLLEMAKQQRGTATAPVKPGQRGVLPRGLVKDYLTRAKGDKSLAEKLAQQDGYETNY